MDTFFNITSWGGFLILAGGIFGLIQEKLHREYGRIQRLNETLAQEHEVLEATNRDLSQVSEQRRRDAEQLRQKNVVIEGLKKKGEYPLSGISILSFPFTRKPMPATLSCQPQTALASLR